MQTCEMSCVKYLIFAFNFLFFISGVALVIIGSLIQAGYAYYTEFVPDILSNAPVLLIVVGCIVLVISFFGCCGATKENYCMIITFSVLLALIFILELTAGIVALTAQGSFSGEVESSMNQSMINIKNQGYADTVDINNWNNLQTNFYCCGINGIKDWKLVANASIPDSCKCMDTSKSCTTLGTESYYTTGCLQSITNFINDNIYIIGGIGIGIAFIQIMGIVCACCLASAVKEKYAYA